MGGHGFMPPPQHRNATLMRKTRRVVRTRVLYGGATPAEEDAARRKLKQQKKLRAKARREKEKEEQIEPYREVKKGDVLNFAYRCFMRD
jgi:PAB1-binding protein PBP1